jgi:hypothetical protein
MASRLSGVENAALEFHDSDLTALEVDDDRVTLRFAAAYIHRSEGVPGVDRGTGWTQEASVALARAKLAGVVRLGSPSLADDEVSLGDRHFAGLVPASLSYVGPVSVALLFLDGSRLRIDAEELHCELIGEPTYVEEFPGSD